MRTPFKLRSGNTTPFKEIGSSPAKQVKGNMPKNLNIAGSGGVPVGQDFEKYAKSIHEQKFDKFQAQKQKGKEFVKNLKTKDVVSKKPVSTLSGTTKAMKNVPKQFAKGAKKLVPKVLKQVAKRVGPVGAVLTAYEVAKTIPKVSKATVKGLKKRAKSGNVNIGRKL